MRHRLFAVLLVLAVPAGACSRGEDETPVSVAAVADATRSADSARMGQEVSFASQNGTTVTEGVVDFRSGASRFVTRGDKSIIVTITVDGQSFLGTEEPIGDGPSWVRLPERSPAWAFQTRSLVEDLPRATTNVERVGTNEVRGDATTTYRLDLHSGSRGLVMLFMPPKVSAKATMDVDGNGRLRRLVAEPERSIKEGLEVPRSALELWDFGVEVAVEAPKAADVLDFDDPAGSKLMARILAGPDVVPGELPEVEEPKLRGPFTKVAGGT